MYLKYLFCTSTIIEGVNTSAKNVVIFDNKKGLNLIDFFDYSNIKGRSGRMMEHYVGKVYNFNKIKKTCDAIMFSHTDDLNIERNPEAHSWARLDKDKESLKSLSFKT